MEWKWFFCNGDIFCAEGSCLRISMLTVSTVCWPFKYNASPGCVQKNAGQNSFHYRLARGTFLVEIYIFFNPLWNWETTTTEHSSWNLAKSEKFVKGDKFGHLFMGTCSHCCLWTMQTNPCVNGSNFDLCWTSTFSIFVLFYCLILYWLVSIVC